MQRRSMRRTRQTATATLSSDDDDDDESFASPSRFNNFMPSRHDDDDSIISMEADDATLHVDAGVREQPAPSLPPPPPPAPVPVHSGNDFPVSFIVDDEQARRFATDEASDLARDSRPPAPSRPLAEHLTWERRELGFRKRLADDRDYQLAVMISAQAGVPINKLIYVPPPVPVVAPPRPVVPVDGGVESLINQLMRFEADVPAAPVAIPANVPPAPPAPLDKDVIEALRNVPGKPVPVGNKDVRRVPVADEGVQRQLDLAHMTVSGGAAYEAARAEFIKDLEVLVNRRTAPDANNKTLPKPISDAEMRELRIRQEAIAMLRRQEATASGDTTFLRRPDVIGEIFVNPQYTAHLLMARDHVRVSLPRTLAHATVEQFRDSSTARSFFVIIAAAFISRYFFVAGDRPQRASDYDRYGESIRYALRQLRFAAYVRRTNSIELRYDAMAERAAERDDRCFDAVPPPSSSTTSTTTAVRSLLLASPYYEPLIGFGRRRR